jgi:AmmeMemoRadiSam system protein B
VIAARLPVGLYSTLVAGPKPFSVRRAAVAGVFYPDDPAQCRAQAVALLNLPESAVPVQGAKGGIVPHAGWICSGAIAGEVIATLAQSARPDVVVVFGAVHAPIELPVAALQSFGAWDVPVGICQIAMDISQQLAGFADLFVTDDRFHIREHAVEVESPLIQVVWPNARLLPIEVPLVDQASEIGRRTARAVLDNGLQPVFLASSDLTHYGPAYRFTPAGTGEAALSWAKQNDRRLLDRVEDLEIEQIVPEVREHLNACGGGAIAAMLAACREIGATGAQVLRHANSYETLANVAPQPPIDAVGYAGVVVV